MFQFRGLYYFNFLIFAPLSFSTTLKAPPGPFSVPASNAIDHVNLLIGNGGIRPSHTGGMIPSTAPPFAMTRWIAQSQVNWVSSIPYNYTLDTIHGFQGTRQPAIWMGESGSVALVPGVAANAQGVKAGFDERGLNVVKDNSGQKEEVISPNYYNVLLNDGQNGTIFVEQTATSRVGQLRFTFNPASKNNIPYILIDAARPSVTSSTPTNITFPVGSVSFATSHTNEVCGSFSERQDSIITPISTKAAASHFNGFFCARFDRPVITGSFGIIQNGTNHPSSRSMEASVLSAYIFFPQEGNGSGKIVVNARIGTSFISIDQARKNIDIEIPDARPSDNNSNGVKPGSLEATAQQVRRAWADKLDRIQIQGGTEDQLHIFYTAVAHALQYPSEAFEYGRYYSAYDNVIHEGNESYTGYSIWDTYRAAWASTILFAPERVPGMVTSMLQDFQQSGHLPMWKNIVETNIMVGTHADSLIGEAAAKNVTGFDTELAWEAVWKDATVPPIEDASVVYSDRQENVDYEVRAGLSTSYAEHGWVADDVHSESGSRTLDYAYDDYAAYALARALGKPENITSFLLNRATQNPFTIFNNDTGFMESRVLNGSFAGPNNGWTEGDKSIYSFDVVQAVPQLIEHRGGQVGFTKSLETHFNGGFNQHTNEPSHHIPYLYSLSGAAFRSQERVRNIAQTNYFNTPEGLLGNEDCGQMSAWFIFSAMGFYPVNPASAEYVVGSPFFEKMTIDLPTAPIAQKNTKKTLTITATGATTKQYIKSLTVNGQKVDTPVIRHSDIANGGEIVFEMSDQIEAWGNSEDVVNAINGSS